jgi:hypothetical protein
MKTKKFTIGIVLFLFAFLANFTVVQAQVTVWDDFDIADGPLTDVNGISGAGWSDAWTYDTKTEGVTVEDGAFVATDGGFGITRYLTTSIPLGTSTSTFYLSFVMSKDESGNFRFAGLRNDGIERYSVGVKADGSIAANIAMNGSTVSSNAGLIENGATYLVVAKWWYEGSKGHMNISAFEGAESIPADEPVAGTWDFEEVGGSTGVIVDKFRIAYSAATVTLNDFKISDTWSDAVGGTVLTAPENLGLVATSTTTANLTWTDNSYNETGSKIYLDGVENGTVGPDVEQYELTGLTELTEYTVGVSAYDGGEETAATELTFTFELDETPPTVAEVSPVNDAVDVDETSDISITFSEAMNQASVEGAITVAPALTNAMYTWESETKLTISSPDDLASATQYTVTIGTAAEDLSGNALAEYVTTFTVILKDIIPPTIVETVPANSAADVLVTSGISITFSEGMDKTSVEGAVTVAPEIPSAAFSWEGDTKLYISGDKLTNSTAYTITIGTGAADLKGNVLAAEETVNFTTGASTLQLYDDFSIANGVVTSANASTGAGWAGPWEYYKGDGGAVAQDGYVSGGSKTILVRELNYASGIGATTYYLSFLALRSPEGSFHIVGGRDWGAIYQWRTGVGVSEDGSLGVLNNSGTYVSSDNSGIFEASTTYLVVMKHTAKTSHKVKLFKAGETVAEPADGEWDYELAQGNTGVALEFFGLDFITAGVNIDEFKVGSSWDDVSGTTIADLSTIPLIAPGNLEVIANSESTAELWWSDNSVVEDGFKVYQDGSEVATIEANSDVYEFGDLVDDQTYTFKVSAYKGDDEAESSEISFTFTFDAENYVDNKIEVAKTETAPVIDGDVDDAWANAFKNPVKRLGPTETAPVDAADYQSTWSAMWDNDNLYFLFEVNDEKLVFNDGSGTGIGQDDGFDMPMAKGANGVWTMNRVNLIAPPESDTTLYFHEGMAAIKGAEKAYKFTETGYNIELSVVLRDFDESIGLFVEGYQFRIDVRYNDDDTEGNRDGQYTWTDKNEAGWTWNNINSLGYVTLVGVIDNDAPTVTGTTPADDATAVGIDSDITITFSEAMDKTSVEAAITVAPALTNATFTWNGDTEVTIAADDFTASTAYTVTIATSAEDANENELAEAYSFSFTSAEGVGIETLESRNIKVFVSENGSLLNIMNYEGMADIYSITGRKVQRIENASQPVNIAYLSQGIYIVKTEAGAVKFVK